MTPKFDIVILGAGESGIGAALLAKKLGIKTFVSDSAQIKSHFKQELLNNNIPFEEKHHSSDIILSAQTIIKSPGIPDSAEIIKLIKQKNIPIISEIEFAAQYSNATIIGITGSNGKTTTTLLTYHIFKNAGLDAQMAGNVGNSFARELAQNDHKYFILELSSFQLDYCFNFNPHIAIILNITPDHLDRYNHDFMQYAKAKFRIIQNHSPNDLFIYWLQDPIITQLINQLNPKSQQFPFSYEKIPNAKAWVSNNQIFLNLNQNLFTMSINELQIKGKHNIYNSMAAAAAAMAAGIKNEKIRNSLKSFTGVEHRLEKFLSIRGVTFINDSKATNVNSVWYALESIYQPIILIMGGIDKGNDYSLLFDLVKQKVKAIVALGVDNSKIIKAFSNIVPVYDTNSMEKAVKKAFELASPGDVVLLSPACASFDLFENYKDRGKKFKQAVRNL